MLSCRQAADEDALAPRSPRLDGQVSSHARHAGGNHRRRGNGFAQGRATQIFEELRLYCYRVASAVGLVSIEIFGYRNPRCKEYAIDLGLALQTTNIIRDVAKDMRHGRIYLPQDEMARFGYSENDLLGAKVQRVVYRVDGIPSATCP